MANISEIKLIDSAVKAMTTGVFVAVASSMVGNSVTATINPPFSSLIGNSANASVGLALGASLGSFTGELIGEFVLDNNQKYSVVKTLESGAVSGGLSGAASVGVSLLMFNNLSPSGMIQVFGLGAGSSLLSEMVFESYIKKDLNNLLE